MSDFAAFNDADHLAIRVVADRLKVEPADLLLCVQAVSVTRCGSTEWSEHDLQIAESCLSVFCRAVIARNNEERYLRATLAKGSPSAAASAQQAEGDDNV